MFITVLTALPAALSAVVLFGAMLVPSKAPSASKRTAEILPDAHLPGKKGV